MSEEHPPAALGSHLTRPFAALAAELEQVEPFTGTAADGHANPDFDRQLSPGGARDIAEPASLPSRHRA
jgi:hypothetical protein